jgi:hypothetical protein
MNATLQTIAGPRIPWPEARRHPIRYLLPTFFFAAAAVVLLSSIAQPYWKMTLHAPQYPKGLTVTGYVNRMEGDVHEIDSLNHYIGMRPLDQAARLERQIAVISLWTFASLLALGTIIHNRLSALLVLPALFFPAAFLLDLHFWLAHFGQHLDPHAPLSSAIKPFTPPVLGIGKVGQFHTVASAGEGLIRATYASGLILVGLVFHRAAYKPLVTKASHAAKA